MLANLLNKIPKALIGPLAVILGIVYFYIQDPPKTICDTQFEFFRKETTKYLYGTQKKGIKLPALYIKDIANCRNSNSIGGCYDWSQGLKKIIISSRTIGEQCSPRLSELNPLLSYYSSSLRVYAHISWNSTEIVRSQLFNWLDREDIIIYCRLKTEYIRLAGMPAYKATEKSLFDELVKVKELPKEEVWNRTILSHNCTVI